MSQATTNIVKDVNFDEVPVEKQRLNYKEIFLNLQEGDNLIRFVDLQGKKIAAHWIKDTQGKQRSVKCPVVGCPCCLNQVPVQYKTFMKIVDKLGTIRIFEFGPQIMKQLRTIVKDLKEENPNALLTQRDVIVNKGPQGSNPLYTVKLVKLNPKPTPIESLRQNAIEEAISKDTLNLSEIVVPWTVERINEYIYGIKNENGVVSSPTSDFNYGKNVEATIPQPRTLPTPTPTRVSTPATEDVEDLSMFES